MNTIKAFSIYITFGLKWLKSNLSLVIILPAIFGGLWQIIELSSISFSFIRFFSASQVVPDGLLILLVLIIFTISGGLLHLAYQMIQGKAEKEISTISSDNKEKHPPQKFERHPLYLWGIALMVLYICFLILTVYVTLHLSTNIDSFLNLLKIVPSIMISMFIAMGCFIFGNVSVAHNKLLSSVAQKSGWLMPVAVIVSIFIIINQFHYTFTFPKNTANIEAVKEQIQEENPGTELEIVYMNDKYIFVRLYGFLQVAGKPQQQVIRVYNFEDLLNTDTKGYTFPEYPHS